MQNKHRLCPSPVTPSQSPFSFSCVHSLCLLLSASLCFFFFPPPPLHHSFLVCVCAPYHSVLPVVLAPERIRLGPCATTSSCVPQADTTSDVCTGRPSLSVLARARAQTHTTLALMTSHIPLNCLSAFTLPHSQPLNSS